MKYNIGSKIKNVQGQRFKIVAIDDEAKRYTVVSLETGFKCDISRSTLYSGRFKDYLTPTKLGIGMMGYAKEMKYDKKELSLWESMLDRCYNKNCNTYKFYGAKGVSVCERWHRFDLFLKDIRKLEGYNLRKLKKGDLHLDKDIKQKYVTTKNKVYSPETCMFVSRHLNSISTSRNKTFFCLTPTNEILRHTVVKYFADEHGLDDSTITKCLKKKRRSCKGYIFSYRKKDLVEIKKQREEQSNT